METVICILLGFTFGLVLIILHTIFKIENRICDISLSITKIACYIDYAIRDKSTPTGTTLNQIDETNNLIKGLEDRGYRLFNHTVNEKETTDRLYLGDTNSEIIRWRCPSGMMALMSKSYRIGIKVYDTDGNELDDETIITLSREDYNGTCLLLTTRYASIKELTHIDKMRRLGELIEHPMIDSEKYGLDLFSKIGIAIRDGEYLLIGAKTDKRIDPDKTRLTIEMILGQEEPKE